MATYFFMVSSILLLTINNITILNLTFKLLGNLMATHIEFH